MSPKQKSPTVPAAVDMTLSNPLEDLLGYQLRRASQVMMADLGTELADLDLKITEMSVMMVIEANPDITQSEISRLLAIQRANMVPLIAQLVRRGFVRKGAVVGRAQALRLTPVGRALMRECHQRVSAHEARFLTSLPKAQREGLVQQLRMFWES